MPLRNKSPMKPNKWCEFNFEVQHIHALHTRDSQGLGHFRFNANPITTVAWGLRWNGNARRGATCNVLHLLVEFAITKGFTEAHGGNADGLAHGDWPVFGNVLCLFSSANLCASFVKRRGD